jgi:TPR repeat protein
MREIKAFIIGCAVALLFTCGPMSALADDEEASFNAGLAALQRGHYAMAYRAWIGIAQSGNARAKSNIGYLYEQGYGVSQDNRKAMAWYSDAAKDGLAEAQHNLGMMYANGLGTEESWGRALLWFKRAAENESLESTYMIGLSYYRGLGQIEDKPSALHYFRIAAEKGYADAQYMLGYMLLAAEGPTLKADPFNAYVWSSLALESGQIQAEEVRDLARMVLEKDDLLRANLKISECAESNVSCGYTN